MGVGGRDYVQRPAAYMRAGGRTREQNAAGAQPRMMRVTSLPLPECAASDRDRLQVIQCTSRSRLPSETRFQVAEVLGSHEPH